MKYIDIVNALSICGKVDHCSYNTCPFYKDDESKEAGSCQRDLMKSALKKLTKLHDKNKQFKAISRAYENAFIDEQKRSAKLVYNIDKLKYELENANGL